jgi:hypothetical protein
MVATYVHPLVYLSGMVRTSKSHKIETVRQNVTKVAADRRSNFIFRPAFYQMKTLIPKLFAASLFRGIKGIHDCGCDKEEALGKFVKMSPHSGSVSEKTLLGHRSCKLTF